MSPPRKIPTKVTNPTRHNQAAGVGLKGSKQYNFSLTQEGRKCLFDLMQIMDLGASAVINQALQRLRLSDEVIEYSVRKQSVLGSEIRREIETNDSQDPCEESSSTKSDPQT